MRRRGFTLFEALISSAALVFVSAGIVGLGIITVRSYRNTLARSDSSMNVSTAMDWISVDLQQARSVTLVNATDMKIFYPSRNTDQSFNKQSIDSVNFIEYYRSTTAGVASTSGTCIARKIGTGAARVICRNVTRLDFSSDLAGSITVNIIATNNFGATYSMTQRATYMRNG